MSNLPHVRRPVAHEKKKRERRSSVVSFSNAIAGRGARRLRRRLRAQRRFLSALTAATLASTILSTTFDLFYVETFLEAYELPLSSYGVGTLFIALISMGNDIVGAYVVDSYAVRSARGSTLRSVPFSLWCSFQFFLHPCHFHVHGRVLPQRKDKNQFYGFWEMRQLCRVVARWKNRPQPL